MGGAGARGWNVIEKPIIVGGAEARGPNVIEKAITLAAAEVFAPRCLTKTLPPGSRPAPSHRVLAIQRLNPFNHPQIILTLMRNELREFHLLIQHDPIPFTGDPEALHMQLAAGSGDEAAEVRESGQGDASDLFLL